MSPARVTAALSICRMLLWANARFSEFDAALQQPRCWGQPDPFVVVVAADERERSVGAADPCDDLGEHVGQLRVDDEEPFLVGLRRGDLQQRDQLAGGG